MNVEVPEGCPLGLYLYYDSDPDYYILLAQVSGV
jgi:hypothetical protein